MFKEGKFKLGQLMHLASIKDRCSEAALLATPLHFL